MLVPGKWQLRSFRPLNQLCEVRSQTSCPSQVPSLCLEFCSLPSALKCMLLDVNIGPVNYVMGKLSPRKVQWVGPRLTIGWTLAGLNQINSKISSGSKSYGSGLSNETWLMECNSLTIHLKQTVQYPLPYSSQWIYFLTYYYRPGSSFAISAHLFPSLLCAW